MPLPLAILVGPPHLGLHHLVVGGRCGQQHDQGIAGLDLAVDLFEPGFADLRTGIHEHVVALEGEKLAQVDGQLVVGRDIVLVAQEKVRPGAQPAQQARHPFLPRVRICQVDTLQHGNALGQLTGPQQKRDHAPLKPGRVVRLDEQALKGRPLAAEPVGRQNDERMATALHGPLDVDQPGHADLEIPVADHPQPGPLQPRQQLLLHPRPICVAVTDKYVVFVRALAHSVVFSIQ